MARVLSALGLILDEPTNHLSVKETAKATRRNK
jgi:ATPase subunit of ABC transporter with duplicated ATPase domains